MTESSTACKQFVGRWQLISCIGSCPKNLVKTGDSEQYEPLGKNPFGMITYTPNYVMVFIAQQQRTNYSTNDIRAIPTDEITKDFPLFESYCGTYQVEPSQQTVIHHVENSKVPNQINTLFKRHYQFDNGLLTLTTINPLQLNGKLWQFELRWRKAESF